MWGAIWRGSVAAAATAVVFAATSAQFAPGWRPGGELPPLRLAPLRLAPLRPVVGDCASAVTKENLGGAPVPSWLVGPVDDVGAAATVVVMVPGAGGANRDTMLGEAEALARCGVRVVTFDKAGPLAVVFRDFDAWERTVRGVVDAARELPGVVRVGVMGWSEGGWITARLLDTADFAVFAGAAIVSPSEQAAWLVDTALAATPDPLRRIPGWVLAQPVAPAWTRDRSTPRLAGSKPPLLGIWGAGDRAVPVAAGVRRMQEARPDADIMVLPDTGHTLAGADWAPRVAEWVGDPATGPARGVQPGRTTDIPLLPEPTWYSNPFLHLPLALGMGLAVGINHHRRRRHGNRTQ